MNFKRILSLLLAAVLALSFFGCRKVDKGEKDDGGKDKNDLPFGMQLIAPAFCESLLYKVGYAYERTEAQNELY